MVKHLKHLSGPLSCIKHNCIGLKLQENAISCWGIGLIKNKKLINHFGYMLCIGNNQVSNIFQTPTPAELF